MYLDDIASEIAAELRPIVIAPMLLRSYAVLLRVKGVDVTSEDIHDAWVGWFADVDPGHPGLRPFEELDEAMRRADEPFAAAVRAVAARHAIHHHRSGQLPR